MAETPEASQESVSMHAIDDDGESKFVFSKMQVSSSGQILNLRK